MIPSFAIMFPPAARELFEGATGLDCFDPENFLWIMISQHRVGIISSCCELEFRQNKAAPLRETAQEHRMRK